MDPGGLAVLAQTLAQPVGLSSGSASVLARLAELLFVEVVRRHVAALPPHEPAGSRG